MKKTVNHFVSASCRGEKCGMCHRDGKKTDASHKVGEEIPSDAPLNALNLSEQEERDPYAFPYRDNLTQYLCCEHFAEVMGRTAFIFCNPPPPLKLKSGT